MELAQKTETPEPKPNRKPRKLRKVAKSLDELTALIQKMIEIQERLTRAIEKTISR